MDERIFRPARMALKDDLLSIPADDRIFYNPQANIMLANLAGYAVEFQKDVDAIDPDLIDAYTTMQAYLVENYFARVSRYTTSVFLRIKMGGALEKRGVAPHIYESPEEAPAFLVAD